MFGGPAVGRKRNGWLQKITPTGDSPTFISRQKRKLHRKAGKGNRRMEEKPAAQEKNKTLSSSKKGEREDGQGGSFLSARATPRSALTRARKQ